MTKIQSKIVVASIAGIILIIAAVLFAAVAPKEEPPKVETSQAAVVNIESDTMQGGIANIILKLESYDIDINSVQIDMYGGYEIKLGFVYNDVSYYIRTPEAETISELMEAVNYMIVKLEDVIDE